MFAQHVHQSACYYRVYWIISNKICHVAKFQTSHSGAMQFTNTKISFENAAREVLGLKDHGIRDLEIGGLPKQF